MRRMRAFRRGAGWGLGLIVAALLSAGADEPKQTINARGLTFEAPKSWKSSRPTSAVRLAQLAVEPAEGDGYPAEVVVTSFGGAAGSLEANLERWRGQFEDENGKRPAIETKTLEGKNCKIVRAETHGKYHPPRFPGAPAQEDRENARLLGAIVTAGDATYYIRMVGPDKTMKKLTPDFDEMLKSIKIAE
jgi:hypothetical protein